MNRTEIIVEGSMLFMVAFLLISGWFLYNELTEERTIVRSYLKDAAEIKNMIKLEVSRQVLNNTLEEEPIRKATKTVGLYHTGYDIYCAYPMKNPFNFSSVDLHEHWHYMIDENECFDLEGNPEDCIVHFCE